MSGAALRHAVDILNEEKAELRAEIERLRALVRSAYAEGFSEGMNEHTKFNGGKPWEDSRARRALEDQVEAIDREMERDDKP